MASPKSSGIYSITNAVNGNQYIGSAINFATRWKYHRYQLNRGTHHNKHLMRAWEQYGASAFTFTILEVVSDQSCLLAREQHYLDTVKPAYNECLIAGSKLGIPQTAKQRAAMAAFNKRQVFTPERRARMSEITRAQWQDPEAREKLGRSISQGQRASAKHKAARQAIGERLRGRKLNISDEERERRRQSTAGLSALRWAKVRAAQCEQNHAVQPPIWE